VHRWRGEACFSLKHPACFRSGFSTVCVAVGGVRVGRPQSWRASWGACGGCLAGGPSVGGGKLPLRRWAPSGGQGAYTRGAQRGASSGGLAPIIKSPCRPTRACVVHPNHHYVVKRLVALQCGSGIISCSYGHWPWTARSGCCVSWADVASGSTCCFVGAGMTQAYPLSCDPYPGMWKPRTPCPNPSWRVARTRGACGSCIERMEQGQVSLQHSRQLSGPGVLLGAMWVGACPVAGPVPV
jgi:hypothetical protein